MPPKNFGLKQDAFHAHLIKINIMKKQKFQLVGKVTGEDRNKALIKFCQAVSFAQVKYLKRDVINPMALCRPNWSWFRCMVVCLYSIAFKVSTIVLLPDWVDSKSARIEVAVAILLRKKIVLL